ncbi:hypothetical protein [Lacticaseibacillus rhamnosus]|uniref:hypothetical protein n=1 Tax=Lacticaseibacillus rhamnosus TaxID=47715 RepID=UPI00237F6277|nr:hypothetical protein [Lacticaseibacillus rhamnosus]MDE3301585.1 hypothetical protein [Lacticaseibacillus rhamnosus]
MSNETKREVYDEIVNEFGFPNDEDYKQLMERYDAAIPDDLPVIPKAVGEILRSAHGQDNLLGVLETAKYGYKVSETLAWIIANQNTFALAWVLGVWRVEGTGEIVKLEEEK